MERGWEGRKDWVEKEVGQGARDNWEHEDQHGRGKTEKEI